MRGDGLGQERRRQEGDQDMMQNKKYYHSKVLVKSIWRKD